MLKRIDISKTKEVQSGVAHLDRDGIENWAISSGHRAGLKEGKGKLEPPT